MIYHRLVLISRPDARALDEAFVDGACKELFGGSQEEWLAPGQACEIKFERTEGTLPDYPATLAQKMRSLAGGRPIDVAVIEDDEGPRALAFPRRKQLLVADMESTIIEQEMLDELADYVGCRGTMSAITERTMRGELAFDLALRERVALLGGLDTIVLEEAAERMTIMPGAGALVRTMRANGAVAALVSGGFTCFTALVAQRLGFDSHQGNTLEIEDGKLTGRVMEPILGREAKLAALERLTREQSLDPQDTLAVGDGANDLDMIRAAGLGVAFRAKPVVAEAAAVAIRHGDLTALLYLQGYHKDEFVL